MAIFLQRQVEKVKKMLLTLAGVSEEAMHDAVRSVLERDADLGRSVLARAAQLDQARVSLEEECLHTLALHQPVAFDLRFVVAVLKIASDLHRIGQHATNVAEAGVALTHLPVLDRWPVDVRAMADQALGMLDKSLASLVQVDADRARAVRSADDRVDAMNRRMYADVITAMRSQPDRLEQLMLLSGVSRQIERVADHACNIAADVIYLADGEVVRPAGFEPASEFPPQPGRSSA
ncbi:MAG: phosphate signaling complex protein PhoU [Planctomycetota bacterium]